MLREISQSRKANLIRFHIHEVYREVRFSETKGRMGLAGGESGELEFNGHGILV